MSFDIIAAYGTGVDGTATNPTNINSYARVTAVANNTITINADDLSAFTAGTEILLHLSGIRNWRQLPNSAPISSLRLWQSMITSLPYRPRLLTPCPRTGTIKPLPPNSLKLLLSRAASNRPPP